MAKKSNKDNLVKFNCEYNYTHNGQAGNGFFEVEDKTPNLAIAQAINRVLNKTVLNTNFEIIGINVYRKEDVE